MKGWEGHVKPQVMTWEEATSCKVTMVPNIHSRRQNIVTIFDVQGVFSKWIEVSQSQHSFVYVAIILKIP
jgi:hypothetical protein